MQRIYFDNAATTPLAPEVLDAMLPYLQNHFGNPSSIYSYGRETRMAIEHARKFIAKTLNATPSEIFFTSGGTESSNTAITAAVRDLGCTHIITSQLEHHATLHTVAYLEKTGSVTVSYVNNFDDGHLDITHLESLLTATTAPTLVTLMHANNEIGNILPVEKVGELCEKYHAFFHCDMVQTIGHYPVDLEAAKVHFANGAAHKFHGPKGVGILYIKAGVAIKPFVFGGGQERNMRAGTENVYGIVGFAKALELASTSFETDKNKVQELKEYFKQQLVSHIPAVQFNGDCNGQSLYTVLNVAFPKTEKSDMLLMNLDINHICASGGSACSSGADVGSHVINQLPNKNQQPIRFSFSKYNTKEEIDIVIEKLKGMVNEKHIL
jgi:cysteine desulfurase